MQSYSSLYALKLNDMIGKMVLAIVPAIQASGLVELKLHAVEEGGIWVENAAFTESLLRDAGFEMMKRKIIFLPFAQVTLLLHPEPETIHHDLWHK